MEVFPDGKTRLITLSEEEARQMDERIKEQFDCETMELKSTRALREKFRRLEVG